MQPDEYLKLAEVEDSLWYFHALHRHVRAALADVAAPHADMLDAGCGTGGEILKLRRDRPRWRYQGIDISGQAVELARHRCGADVALQVGSVTELPVASASCDAVMSLDVICQVDNPGDAVREFYRVLRPGGTVVINVPAYLWLWSYHDDTCQTKHRYVRAEVAQLLTDAGFVGQRLTHWNAFALPVIWAKRKLFATPSDTSDVRRHPAPVQAAFLTATALERAWLNTGGAIPFGSSVFATAKKPA